MTKYQSIRHGILELLASTDTFQLQIFTFSDIVKHVRSFYKSSSGYGKQFVMQRTNEELYRMRQFGLIRRVSRGKYRITNKGYNYLQKMYLHYPRQINKSG